ncbi:hypothetical protein EB74_18500 [Mycobacterium sp. SWH-M5]|nr:hypothetical protein EB74_18500 [Mycobacterium sp. SWH-M5]
MFGRRSPYNTRCETGADDLPPREPFTPRARLTVMRTVKVIDAELQALAAYRRVSWCSVRVIDGLLDERLASAEFLAAELAARRGPP